MMMVVAATMRQRSNSSRSRSSRISGHHETKRSFEASFLRQPVTVVVVVARLLGASLLVHHEAPIQAHFVSAEGTKNGTLPVSETHFVRQTSLWPAILAMFFSWTVAADSNT